MSSIANDPDVTIIYVPPNGTCVARSNLRVKLNNRFNRKVLPVTDEANIEDIWQERLSANPTLWNGSKFRLDSIEICGGYTTFNLGITCYKDFIGTNWSPKASTYLDLGNGDFGTRQAYMSDALGVGALVETADHFIILIRRSDFCGEAVGLLDIPGGHPEPKELVGKIEAEEIDIASLQPKAVVDEIFNSTAKEIVYEVNIPEDKLTDPVLIGVARNTTSAGRPSSEYYVKCSLSSSEVKHLYNKGNQLEVEESTNIVFIPIADLPALHEREALWSDLAPSAKGCITLFQMMLSAKKCKAEELAV